MALTVAGAVVVVVGGAVVVEVGEEFGDVPFGGPVPVVGAVAGATVVVLGEPSEVAWAGGVLKLDAGVLKLSTPAKPAAVAPMTRG